MARLLEQQPVINDTPFSHSNVSRSATFLNEGEQNDNKLFIVYTILQDFGVTLELNFKICIYMLLAFNISSETYQITIQRDSIFMQYVRIFMQ